MTPAVCEPPVCVPRPAPRCARGLHSVKDYRTYASRVYRRRHVSTRAHQRLMYLRRCQRSPRATRAVGKLRTELRAARVERQREARALAVAASLTPYACSFGRSAIPCSIVACESKGDWSAANPSGAVGFYQFLGKRIPWPVRSQADRNAHHRLAASLWAGGAGASHWAQCL